MRLKRIIKNELKIKEKIKNSLKKSKFEKRIEYNKSKKIKRIKTKNRAEMSKSKCCIVLFKRYFDKTNYSRQLEIKLRRNSKVKKVSGIKWSESDSNIIQDNGYYFCEEDFKGELNLIEELEQAEVFYSYKIDFSILSLDDVLKKIDYETYLYIKENDIIVKSSCFIFQDEIIFIKNIDYYLLMEY